MKFEELLKINVNDYTESKNGLTYLSWTYAWSEFKKTCPGADYEIVKQENGLPFVYDSNTGYMVFTKVTDGNSWLEMWLPVMDGNNKAMLDHKYSYQVKEYQQGKWTGGYIEKTVEPASMFDINKTIMRCLVKNIAMFGLGLYIYSGEDLPEGYEVPKEEAMNVVLDFGKYQGRKLVDVIKNDEGYKNYLLNNSKEYIKSCIEVITGEKRITDSEQDERIKLLVKIQDLERTKNIDHSKALAHYKVESDSDMTLEQLRDYKVRLGEI